MTTGRQADPLVALTSRCWHDMRRLTELSALLDEQEVLAREQLAVGDEEDARWAAAELETVARDRARMAVEGRRLERRVAPMFGGPSAVRSRAPRRASCRGRRPSGRPRGRRSAQTRAGPDEDGEPSPGERGDDPNLGGAERAQGLRIDGGARAPAT